MSKVFKVGLIGCGHIAETYFRAHKYFKNFKIIKCADVREKAALSLMKLKAKESLKALEEHYLFEEDAKVANIILLVIKQLK